MKDKLRFPEKFLWGAATSSHQVEGNNRNNDWWKWEEEGRVKEPSGKACNQYNHYRDDFKLAKELNHNGHRFSLEWSRIEPEEGKFDKEAISHYKEMIKTLRALDIEPIVTIYHFTLPLWFSQRGGWLARNSEYKFAAFAERAAEEFGEDVRYWITLNEPVGYTYSSYIEGSWPPGRRSFKDAARVFSTLLLAHSLAYNAIHKLYRKNNWTSPKVSISKHVLIFNPCRKSSILDRISTRLRYYYFNTLFIRSLLCGWCIAPGIPITRLPVKRSLDFLGINYYTRDYVHYAGISPVKIFGTVCTLIHHKDEGKRNFLKWEIYPEGIYKVLKEYSSYNLPILITENGICTNDDNDRADFIKVHLKEVARAIRDGVDVLGYLHWSLIDNFEWAHGYGPRFGLIEVDYATQRRSIRPSARVYAEIIKKNK